MNAILNMARLHVLLTVKDRAVLIQAFVVPVILILVLAVAINEQNFANVDILVDVDDQDGSPLSAQLLENLRRPATDSAETLIFCVYGAQDIPAACELESSDRYAELGTKRLAEQTVAGSLVIPAGFGAALERGESLTLNYATDEALSVSDVGSARVAAAVNQLNASLAIAATGVEGVETYLDGFPDGETRLADFNALREAAQVRLNTPPAQVETESSGERIVIGLGARQSVPGMGSMFVLFYLLTLAQYMVEERKQGTLTRLFTLPARQWQIVLGKILGAFLFGVMQFTVFILLGALLGIDWGDSPLAVALIVLSYCLAGTALGFLLATLVKTAAQAGAMVTLMGLILAPLGGAWWPLTIVPEFMRTLGHLSPIAWAMDGFYDLLYYKGGVADVLPEVAILLVFATAFAGLASLNFKYEN
jgi:ABC-2 type transport system permease protein